MRKVLPVLILLLLMLTACGDNNETTTESSYGGQLIDRYEKSSETVDEYNKINQDKFDGINQIDDEQ